MSEELKPCPFCGGKAKSLTLDSESCIRNDWGDIYPIEDVRIEENKLLLAEQEPT